MLYRLWDALVEHSARRTDRLLAFQLLHQLACNGGLSTETMRLILEEKLQHVQIRHLVAEENEAFYDLFINCFKQVKDDVQL